MCYHLNRLPNDVGQLTLSGAYFLYKNLQYQLANEAFERAHLAGSSNAKLVHCRAIAELDYIYGKADSLPTPEEIERSIQDGNLEQYS